MSNLERVEREMNEFIDFLQNHTNPCLCNVEIIKGKVKPSMKVVKKDNSPIEDVIFNDPATIVLWKDGTKAVVKCQKGDTYNKEMGLALCICKKLMGKQDFHNEFAKWVK